MYALNHVLLHIFGLLLDLLATRRLSEQQKDLEILLLRHQLRILQRTLPNSRPPRVSVWEKGILALFAVQFRRCSERTGRTLGRGYPAVQTCSNLTPSYGGTENWSGANGPSHATNGLAGRLSEASWNSSSCGWPKRTPGGVIARYRANCSNSDTRSAAPASGTCSSTITSLLLHSVRSKAAIGAHSWGTTQAK